MSEFQESSEPRLRPVRSFVRREGRITTSQAAALRDLWPVYALPESGPIVPAACFGRRAPLHLEIGAGDGECMLALAEAHPEFDFIAAEVHRPGLGHLLNRLEKRGLSNVRVYGGDVNDLLARLADDSLSGAYVFFPDPWPKTRHHKRRLVQAPFLARLRPKLLPQARLYVATDIEGYAEHVIEVTAPLRDWLNLAGAGRYAPRLKARIVTKFERKGLRENRRIFDFCFARAPDPAPRQTASSSER
jgi:tRNA (guanine-N7-)-methyltransferase